MNIWISSLYSGNKAVFLDFIERTNQKDVIAQAVIEMIPTIVSNESLVITDIGAGSWIIASKILPHSQKSKNFTYYYIEPAQELIREFQGANVYENITFMQHSVENIDIPKSDIIIASFVFQAIWNKGLLLRRMYESLKPGWVIVIVNQNINTLDFTLKHLLWYSFSDVTSGIISELDTLSIQYTKETRESVFYWVQDILSLNEAGRNCISFLLFKNFENISSQEKEIVLDYIANNSRNDQCIRQEDYIYIRK